MPLGVRKAMKRISVPDWIEDGEKFALIGLDVELEPDVSRFDLLGGLIVLRHADFVLPGYWRQWLGSMRVDDVSGCSLFLLAKLRSSQPEVLDGENQRLNAAVGDWFMGLVLETNFATSDALFIASGSCKDGKVDVRQFGSIRPPMPSVVSKRSPISVDQLCRAALIRESLKLAREVEGKGNWRILRCLSIYREARCEGNVLDRIHQFARCIEGLIVPKQGDTKKQFKSRTELFIGSQYHEIMGEIYEIRSEVENLHENRRLETNDRAKRIFIAEREVCVSGWLGYAWRASSWNAR